MTTDTRYGAGTKHRFGSTNTKYKSVADIDTTESSMCIMRTINGSTKQYIEYLTPNDYNSSLTVFIMGLSVVVPLLH